MKIIILYEPAVQIEQSFSSWKGISTDATASGGDGVTVTSGLIFFVGWDLNDVVDRVVDSCDEILCDGILSFSRDDLSVVCSTQVQVHPVDVLTLVHMSYNVTDTTMSNLHIYYRDSLGEIW